MTTAAAPSGGGPGPLALTEFVSADRAPWPTYTLVLAWIDGASGRLYPLPLLDRYEIVHDKRAGRRVAATWSRDTGSAVLLAVPDTMTLEGSEAAPDGWRRVRDRASGAEWFPGKPLPATGETSEQLWPVPESAVMPLRLARRLAPEALVAISRDPPAVLNASWQRTRKTTLIPSLKERLTIVLAREDAAAWRLKALPPHGLVEASIGGLKVLVVRAHRVTRAFMAPLGATRIVAWGPWTGSPWLWTEGVGLWDGMTGRRFDNGASATQALTVLELTETAFRAHWPGGALHDD